MMLWKCYTHYVSKFGKLISGHRTGKGQFSFQSLRKAMPKNECTIALISQASKIMLKILQARLQQYMNRELPDVQLHLEKAEEPEIKLPSSVGSINKTREFQKNIYFCLLTMSMPLTVWITTNCGKFWKRWEYQTTWPASWEICM